MPIAKGQSETYVKVRRDHANETAEDYVEAISDLVHQNGECRVKDLAAHMGVSHVTVTRIVARLRNEDLIEPRRHRPIRLTAKGERLAAAARRRHDTVLAFLTALGVPREDALRDAEGIEHHVGPRTLACMERYVDRHHQEEPAP